MSEPATAAGRVLVIDDEPDLRTLYELSLLREGLRVDTAADDLGVTPVQLVKDLKVLFMCGLPGGYPDDLIDVDLDALEGEGMIRVTNADYLARPLRLSPTEATAIIVAGIVVAVGVGVGFGVAGVAVGDGAGVGVTITMPPSVEVGVGLGVTPGPALPGPTDGVGVGVGAVTTTTGVVAVLHGQEGLLGRFASTFHLAA